MTALTDVKLLPLDEQAARFLRMATTEHGQPRVDGQQYREHAQTVALVSIAESLAEIARRGRD